MSRFVDNALDAAEHAAVEAHVEGCEDCQPVVAMLVKLRGKPAELASQPDPLARTAAVTPAHADAALGDTLAAPPPSPSSHGALSAGARFDRYVVRRVLGRGGMGVVYQAHDPDLNRDVAIKVLRRDFARTDPDAPRRIAHEARVMARISDPNVISVFDVGKHEDSMFIAMELVTGGNLRAWLARSRRTIAEILAAFIAAGRGLIAAHDAGIVHRDFKPDNVLVGDDGRVRVTDFGIAYERGDAVTGSSSSRDEAGGTPAYMAPEQFEGGPTDARTDQFSFCVALYEALYGKRPFAGTSYATVGDAVTHGRIEPATDRRVPASLRAIVVRGLAVNPADRFQTLSALLHALSRDRSRGPRRVALAAAIALGCVAIGLGADWNVRDRLTVVTRAGFAAARAQLDKLIAFRSDVFASQADVLYAQGPVQELAATHSDADFGLGSPDEDRGRFARIHDALVAASWVRLARTGPGYELAIADEKGRLLYNSVEPSRWGNVTTGVATIGAAYTMMSETSIGVVRADAPDVIASGVLGGRRTGLYVLFARVRLGENHLPRAAFVQLIPSAELLGEVSSNDESDDEPTELSIIAPGGAIAGNVPRELASEVTSDDLAEVVFDGDTWLVQRVPLRAPDQRAGVASFVLARRARTLFPHIQLLLSIAALALAGLAVGGVLLGRARSLTRRFDGR
jgi:predicted Ser/Thr protein kinase